MLATGIQVLADGARRLLRGARVPVPGRDAVRKFAGPSAIGPEGVRRSLYGDVSIDEDSPQARWLSSAESPRPMATVEALRRARVPAVQSRSAWTVDGPDDWEVVDDPWMAADLYGEACRRIARCGVLVSREASPGDWVTLLCVPVPGSARSYEVSIVEACYDVSGAAFRIWVLGTKECRLPDELDAPSFEWAYFHVACDLSYFPREAYPDAPLYGGGPFSMGRVRALVVAVVHRSEFGRWMAGRGPIGVKVFARCDPHSFFDYTGFEDDGDNSSYAWSIELPLGLLSDVMDDEAVDEVYGDLKASLARLARICDLRGRKLVLTGGRHGPWESGEYECVRVDEVITTEVSPSATLRAADLARLAPPDVVEDLDLAEGLYEALSENLRKPAWFYPEKGDPVVWRGAYA